MKPDYVVNDIKYQRALAEAKDPTNEAEVKEIYVSFGGLLAGKQQVDSPSVPSAWTEPEQEPIIEPTPEVVEPVVEPEPAEELPVVGEETSVSPEIVEPVE